MKPNEVESTRVVVQLAERSYDVVIGRGLIERASSWDGLHLGAHGVVVTNPLVASYHLDKVRAALAPLHRRVHVVVLPDGEQYKDWHTLQQIFDALLQAGCDRRTVVYALGGGVIGDMAGFASACYMRGIGYVQIPTTLLAQVDSSVGGKTAINHPMGKNMIGAFHQPLRVLCDVEHLSTLPDREFRSGLAEVVKYGPISDWAFFEWMEHHVEALVARDPRALVTAIRRSCEIKAGVVSRDEREGDLRAILNFGHTFGHAIEAGLGYGAWLHGEAVGCGMVMAAELSCSLGSIERSIADRIRELIARCGLPVKAPALGIHRWLELMRLDKKAQAGEIQFVLLSGPGVAGVRTAPESLVCEVLAQHSAAAQEGAIGAA